MKKNVIFRAKVLFFSLLILDLLFIGPSAHALEKETSIDLSPLFVSAQRQERPLSDLSQDVTIIEADEIENMPADTPADILATITGVDVSQRTEFTHTTPLSIRGSLSRNVLLLLDGIPFNNQISQQADILPLLPFNNLDRIEVIKGAGSSAWGAGLGGVIHLITKDPVVGEDKLYGRVTSSFAGFNTQRQAFEVGSSFKDFGIVFDGEYQESGGARENPLYANKDDTLSKKFYTKMEKKLSEFLKFAGSLGYIGAKINEGVRPSNQTWDKLLYYARFGQVGLEFEPDDHACMNVAFKTNRQVIETDTLDGLTDADLSFSQVRNNYYGGEIKGNYEFEGGHAITFGYDGSYHQVKSPLLPEVKDVLIHAPYAQGIIALDPFKINLGVRYDHNVEFGDQWSPTSGVVYQLPYVRETFFRINVAKAFDAPPIYWKYFENPGRSTLNNPNLSAEKAWVYEASIDTKPWDETWIKFGVYRSEIEDAIDTVQVSPGQYMKQNFEHFRQEGFEAEVRQKLLQYFSLTFGSGFNDVEDRITHATVMGRGISRYYFKLGASFHHEQLFDAGLFGRYQRWDSLASSEPNDHKFIWDIKFQKKIFRKERYEISIFSNIYNLTNSKYWLDLDFPLPGRYFEGGVEISF